MTLMGSIPMNSLRFPMPVYLLKPELGKYTLLKDQKTYAKKR